MLLVQYLKKSKQYWVVRGWSPNESYVKVKEYRPKNCKSIYSRDFWLEKINPATNFNYTITEADFERNSRRPIRKEYWVKRGYTEVDAQQLAFEIKTRNNKLGATASAKSNVRKIMSKRCSEYYTVRGYNENEAKKLVSSEQKHFSKNICIEKYGYVEGIKIWKNRQDQWQSTLNAKSNTEIARINKLKLFKGGSASKGELQLFECLVNQGFECNKQYAILKNNTQHYVYDIIYKNKIIEYNGDFWHASPEKYKEYDLVKLPGKIITAKEIWDTDKAKIKFAESRGFQVLVVWESEFKQHKETVIKKCIQFLTQ